MYDEVRYEESRKQEIVIRVDPRSGLGDKNSINIEDIAKMLVLTEIKADENKVVFILDSPDKEALLSRILGRDYAAFRAFKSFVHITEDNLFEAEKAIEESNRKNLRALESAKEAWKLYQETLANES